MIDSRPFRRMRVFYIKKRRKTMKIYEELVARGLIAQVTDEEEIRDW